MSKKREDRDIKDYLNDILEMIEDIKNFTEGISSINCLNLDSSD